MNRFIRHRTFFAVLAVVMIWGATLLLSQNRIVVGPYGVLFRSNTATDTATLTTTQMAPGILVGTPTGAATYTTPTATNLCSAFYNVGIVAPGTNSNYGYDLWIRNTSGGANTITIAGGTGVTLATGNTNTIAQNHTRLFKVVATNCTPGGASNAWTIFSGPDSAH